jgi:tetratricopeptide (TPR) repeat protein
MTALKYVPILIAFLGLSGRLWSQETRGPKVGNTAPAQASGQTWALIVGVSQYQHIDSLRYADDDALAFYNYLISPAGGSVPKSNIQLLVNEKATFGQLDRALGNLLDFVKPNDRVFVYFSGHGDQETKTIAQRGFLLTHDSFSSNYNSTAFAVIYLQDYIATLSTKNQAQVIMFLDACRAGKLAGSEIGGVQLTGQQLLKQVSNEVKFMACQANEVSLEGQQWGGGRGLFSYHLIRGLQGLADTDQDLKVSLRELERYLEDHVTTEAAPTRQNPVLVAADKAVTMSQIDIPTLAAVRDNTKLPTFAAVQGRGFAENVLTVADTTAKKWYADFHAAIAQKRLMDTTDAADMYFERLVMVPFLEKLHPFIKREFAAALLEESSKVFGVSLESTNVGKSVGQYQKSVRYLEKAYRLLGKNHFSYPNLRAQAFYYKGLIAETNNLEEALKNYREAIVADSSFSPAYNDLGRVLLLKKMYKEAQTTFEKGLKYAPQWSFLHLNYGMALANQNHFKEAEIAYKKSIELKSDEPMAYKDYGNLLTRQIRYEEAEKAYKKSLELKTDDAEVYNNYGILLNAQKRYDEAETVYKKSLELQPNDAQVYSNYGIALTALNRHNEAETFFKKSIQLAPAEAQTYFNYGILLTIQNRQEEAETNFKKSIELNPNSAIVYNSYGVLLASQNRLPEAETAYKKYIELNPNNALVFGNYGNLLSRQNRLKEAETAYRKAIELNSNDANVHKSYAILLKNQNRFAEAEMEYQKAIQLKTDDAEVYKSYGALLASLNRREEAEAAFKRAIELNPNDALVYNSFGILLAAKNRLPEAEAAYKRSIEISPVNGLVYSNYGNLLARQNRVEEAETAYKKAIELMPGDANLQSNYGTLLESQNRLEEAETAYKKAIELNADYFRAYYYLAGIKAKQNQLTEAIDLLKKSLEKGFANFESMNRNPALDNLREMPEFKSLMEKYRRN